MKRLYILLSAMVSVGCCYAAQLSPDQALDRAMKSHRSVKSMSGIASKPELVMTGLCANGNAAYYVFKNSASTMFVSADDVAQPVLGYTDGDNFDADNIPPQLQWWLDEYARQIEWASKNAVAYAGEPCMLTGAAIEPMLKTRWDQDYPYNYYCPDYSGYRTVAGCVAISMSQVMKYFEWPKTEVPSISYQWKDETLTSPAVTFDWGHMVDNYMSGYDDTELEAVTRLIQTVGYSIDTDYNPSWTGGSSAYSDAIRPALVNTFNYDPGIIYYYRDYFETEKWEQMVYDNLANCGPVIYDGQGTNGRHSFVCDGYDGNGKYHMNWGWGGSSDGYYALLALNPPTLGIGGGEGGFNYMQGAVFGIRPIQENSKPADPYIVSFNSLNASFIGKLMKLGSDDTGFYNFGAGAATFTFGAEIENVGTGEIRYVASGTLELGASSGIRYFTFNLPATLVNGIYKVTPCYKVNDSDWRHVLFYVGDTDHAMIKIKNGNVTLGAEVPTDPKVSVVDWNVVTNFMASAPYKLTVDVENSFIVKKDYTLDASLCDSEGEGRTKVADLGSKTITIKAFNEATMTFEGELGDITPGKYYLVLSADGDDVVKEAVDVAPGTGAVTTIVIDNDSENEVYDLNGRVVNGTPAPGVYIVNGVKTVIR